MRGLNTKITGNAGENIAVNYLEERGMTIVARNVRLGDGELDIIAKDGDTLVFVEVKTRSNYNYGSALEMLTAAQIKRIIHAAKIYIASKKYYNISARFDFIAIQGDSIEYVQDAFWLN